MKRQSKRVALWLVVFLMAVCLSLGLTAVSAEVQSGSISDDFGAESGTSVSQTKAYEHSYIIGGKSSHGALPGDVWGASVKPGTGYFVYEVDAGAGNALQSLTLDLTAIISHYGLTDHVANNIKVYTATSPGAFGAERETYGAVEDHSQRNFQLDLSEEANGNRILYVKIELNNVTSGTYFDDNGKLSLTYVGTKLFTVNLNYTFDVDPNAPNLKDFIISDDFTKHSLGDSNAASSSGVYASSGSHGMVPASAWGDPINAGTGYLVYQLSPENGGVFESLLFTGSARVGWTNQPELFKDNAINLYVSDDGQSWGEAVYTKAATGEGYSAATFSCDLTAQAQGKRTVYVKIELVHAPGSVSLTYCGIKLYQAGFTGKYVPDEVVETNAFEETFAIDADSGLSNLDLNDNLKTMVSSGSTYATIDEYLYASGGVILEAPELQEFYSLKLSMPARCTVYNGKVFDNAMTILVSRDNVEYTAVQAFSTDTNWSKKQYEVDLSEATRGWAKVYVKISLAFPEGWTDSTDWLAFGTMCFTGGTVERTNFDIIYHNMENASYEGTANPSDYDAGSAFEFAAPVREHYEFGGWYLDADLTQKITGITAEHKGNVEVYAKWTAETVKMTLDANGGAFADESLTKELIAVYDGTLSRENLPENPVGDAAFIGWYQDAECLIPWIFEEDLGEPTVVDGSVLTLYAKYGQDVTVTFDYADGVTESREVVYTLGDAAVRPADPAREGYLFGGWKLNDADYDFESELTQNITLTAFWAEIFEISYTGIEGAQHTNPASFTCLDNELVLVPAEKTGYLFEGWYLDGAPVETVDTAAQGDIVLEARWTVKTYALTLIVGENGSITPSELKEISFEGQTFTVVAEEGYRISSITVNGDGYRADEDGSFVVQGIDADVTIIVNFAARVTLGTGCELTYPGSSDWTSSVYDLANLEQFTGEGNYAGWASIADPAKPGYVVYSFRAPDGATFRSMTVKTRARVFTFEGSVAVLNVYLAVDGGDYTLAGTQESSTDGGKVFDLSFPLEVNGASSVRIKIEIESGYGDWVCFNGMTVESNLTMVTVTFKDGDQVLGANASQQKGGVFVPMDPAPVKDGYEFLGWYLDGACTQKVPADYAVTAAMSVYAKWAPVTYEITYHLDGGINGDNVETYTVTDEIILEPASKEGYLFAGWYLNADFTGEAVTSLSGLTGNLNLYAKYTAGIAVNYELNGGTNAEGNPTVLFDESVELLDPVREGYTFAGWYADAEFTDLVTVLEPTGEPITLYAKWIASGSNPGGNDTSSCGSCGTIAPFSSGDLGGMCILVTAGILLLVAKAFRRERQ